MSTDPIRQLIEEGIPFVNRMGLKVEQVEPGRCKLRVPLAPNTNHIGTMYAGAQFTLGEIPGGVLCVSSFDMSRFFPIVKEMSIRFLKPATSDLTIDMQISKEKLQQIGDEADSTGKSEFTLTGELKNDKGEIVAETTALYQLRKR